MVEARRFLVFVIFVLLLTLLIWFGLRFYAGSRPLSTYQTDLAARVTSMAPLHVDRKSPPGQDQKAVACKLFYKDGSWSVEQTGRPPLPLPAVLAENPNTIFFLDIVINDTSDLKALKENLDEEKKWQQIVFISKVDGILQDLRELSPRWTFSTGNVFMARLISFYSIGLGQLLDIPADILYLSRESQLTQRELDDLAALAHSQKKLVLFEQSSPELDTANVDIVLLGN